MFIGTYRLDSLMSTENGPPEYWLAARDPTCQHLCMEHSSASKSHAPRTSRSPISKDRTGYLELEMYSEAAEELGKIDPACLAVPEVLSVRLWAYAGLQNWGMMQSVAKRLRSQDPGNPQWAISAAYATRRAESIQAARSILLEAVKSNPAEPMVRYNLACYECQLGNFSAAEEHLIHATKADVSFKAMALDDSDLKPLWTEIGRLEAEGGV